VSLLRWVTSVLDARGAPYALIGATALAVHGVPRATADLDLLSVDARCLDEAWWAASPSRPASVTVDVRVGDAADPLAGVARFVAPAAPSLDLIVGRPGWQADVVGTARMRQIAGEPVPVVEPAGLVLLKLYAGGPQDAWDVAQLLDAAPATESLVERDVHRLPADSIALWRRILQDRS